MNRIVFTYNYVNVQQVESGLQVKMISRKRKRRGDKVDIYRVERDVGREGKTEREDS